VNQRQVASALLAASLCSAALATEPPAGGVADLLAPRSLALGGGVGLAGANEALFVNPAAYATSKRYSAEALYAVDRRGGSNAGQYLGTSVVDSVSGPMSGSLGYVRSVDGQRGNIFMGGLAGPLSDHLYLGAVARYVSVGGAEPVTAVTADAGLLFEAMSGVTLGAAGYNLIPTSHQKVLPRGVGAGLGVGSDTTVKLVADWHGDFDRASKTTNRFSAGLEALLGSLIPLRAAWEKDETLSTSWWCVGAGIVSQDGVSLDLGYRQGIHDSNARVVALSLRLVKLDL
jgi:hypothetical protein